MLRSTKSPKSLQSPKLSTPLKVRPTSRPRRLSAKSLSTTTTSTLTSSKTTAKSASSHKQLRTATPRRKMSSTVHQMSTNGFSGESTSAQYDLVRPKYADSVIEALLTPIANAYSQNPESTTRPLRLLDLGCGTGISTKDIAVYMYEHVSESIEYEIYCADPNASMVNVLEKSLTLDNLRKYDRKTQAMKDGDLKAVLDTIKLPLVASVDDLPYKPGFFDGVIACQAFHWFASPRSLINIQRILTPTGFFAFSWNYWVSTQPNLDRSTVPEHDQWLFKLADLIEPLYIETNTPQQTNIDFRGLFTNTTQYEQKYGIAAPFSELYSVYLDPREQTSSWMNRDFFHKRIDSISVVHTKAPDDKAAFMAKIDALLDETTTPSRINPDNGDKEWKIGFFCEIHFSQNSKAGPGSDPMAF